MYANNVPHATCSDIGVRIEVDEDGAGRKWIVAARVPDRAEGINSGPAAERRRGQGVMRGSVGATAARSARLFLGRSVVFHG